MNQDMLISYLEEFNPAELFYYTCLEESADPKAAFQTLEAADQKIIRKNCGVFPESEDSPIPRMVLNAGSAAGSGRRTVRLSKLCRFVPAALHTHDFFEMIYVLKGTCVHTIDGKHCPLTEGDLCLLSPCTCHSVYADGDTLAVSLCISSSIIENLFISALREKDMVSDFLRSALFLKDFSSCLLFHTLGDEDVRSQILEMYMEEFQDDEYADYMITSMLMVFFLKIVRKYKRTVESPAFNPPVYEKTSHILRYMQENYATASLADLSDMLNYSIPYCSKYIKSCTGYSFSQLQQRIRCEKASAYLLNTDMSVEKISEKIGYANPENFMRMFKKICGISPSQFRFSHQGSAGFE